jgi:16S rRNA (guanine(966)-N(2))-methyltransferase RsmD
MDRMRESVFAVLGDLSNRSFLDLFSGSGIIALEAASRGASPVEAVEADPLKRKILLKNVSIAPIRIQCRFMAVELYIRRSRRAFDFIFCDPPFSYRFKGDLLLSIAGSALMHPDSLLMIHRPKAEGPVFSGPPEAGGESGLLTLKETRYYGTSELDYFEKIRKNPAWKEKIT